MANRQQGLFLPAKQAQTYQLLQMKSVGSSENGAFLEYRSHSEIFYLFKKLQGSLIKFVDYIKQNR